MAYEKDTLTTIRLQPGDGFILRTLRDEGYNISALFRKTIRTQYKQVLANRVATSVCENPEHSH